MAEIKQCTCDLSVYAKISDLATYATQANLSGLVKKADLATTEYVEEKTNVPEYQLPYTAAELEARLSKL